MIGRIVGRAIGRRLFKMTPARRAALKRAVQASARARRKGAASAAPKLTRIAASLATLLEVASLEPPLVGQLVGQPAVKLVQ